jgi:hypothetical protein
MFSSIEPWVSGADLAICHFEGTIARHRWEVQHYPHVVSPPQIVSAIAGAGYDTCSVAGNHILDRGWEGVTSTLDAFDAALLGHAGVGRTITERLPDLHDVGSAVVGHLAYTYGVNVTAADRPGHAVNVIDPDAILADAAAARARGADFVVVSLHWGDEYTVGPSDAQRSLARTLLASDDVDLILGHHAHAVQPIEVVNGKFVVYGMGNHLSSLNSFVDAPFIGAQHGLLVRVVVTEQPSGGFAAERIDVVPTWVRDGDFRVLAVPQALALDLAPEFLLAASLADTVRRVWALDPKGVVLAPAPWPAVACAGRWATIVGTDGDDVIIGTPGSDVIVGRGGDDTIDGNGGDDVICGGAGNDRLLSGRGRSRLFGGEGDDTLIAGSFRDHLVGGDGEDLCLGPATLTEC